MRLLKFIFIISGIAIYALSCTQEKDDILDCDPSHSEFKEVFGAMLGSGHANEITMDTEVHEYTFNVASPKSVCLIGFLKHKTLHLTICLIFSRQ